VEIFRSIPRITPYGSAGRWDRNDGACRRSQKIFMVTIPALHPGKAVVQVATLQVAVNDLLKVGPRQNPYRLSNLSS